MKTYLIRWMPMSYTPGNDVREKIVQAYNEGEAKSQIGEPYSYHMVWEMDTAE